MGLPLTHFIAAAHSRLCAGFSDAEMLGSPHARTVGVGEAPRHEVAGGGAVQKALQGGAPVGTELAK